ncbi:putative vesicle-associated membrane-protein-associated protein [Medicago truncatula]|uniref:Putative vesicle-associated membrane-protein-associated protein n=1 Tax=Medicago truncatula TaxID=3880 RepID=A0A396I3F7_MEDTR|nr:putative vesicle-associated membrane-protein-associated protein [Medicago truncatula]
MKTVELGKLISFTKKLLNKSDRYVAFKVNTPNPKTFCVTPNPLLVLPPRSTCDIKVTMQAQEEAPPDMQCKDTFVIQRVFARPGKIMKDVTPEMFEKDSGYEVKEVKVTIVYVVPPKPPSPVQEGSDENLSPQASVFSDKARELISKLTKERNSVIEQNQKLQEELVLHLFRRFSFMDDCAHFILNV